MSTPLIFPTLQFNGSRYVKIVHHLLLKLRSTRSEVLDTCIRTTTTTVHLVETSNVTTAELSVSTQFLWVRYDTTMDNDTEWSGPIKKDMKETTTDDINTPVYSTLQKHGFCWSRNGKCEFREDECTSTPLLNKNTSNGRLRRLLNSKLQPVYAHT